jgi:hypothetical protein
LFFYPSKPENLRFDFPFRLLHGRYSQIAVRQNPFLKTMNLTGLHKKNTQKHRFQAVLGKTYPNTHIFEIFLRKELTQNPKSYLMHPVARIAQLVEQRIENPRVPGSIPGSGTTFNLRCSGD